MSEFWSHLIPFPSIPEQSRIVERIRELMGRADELAILEAARDLSRDALLPAALDEVFGGENSGEELRNLLAVEPQNGMYLPQSDYVGDGTGTPMVHMGDMFRRFELSAEFPRRVLASPSLIKKYELNTGDVLVARRSIVYEGSASMTEVGTLTEPTLFESSILRIRPCDRLLPGYLVAFFFSRKGTERRLRGCESIDSSL